MRCQRGEPSNPLAALYVLMAMAMPNLFRMASGTLAVIAASHRLINKEATESTLGLP